MVGQTYTLLPYTPLPGAGNNPGTEKSIAAL
jgi:hypothetical protein